MTDINRLKSLMEALRSKEHRQPINPNAVYRTRDVALFEEAAEAIEELLPLLSQSERTEALEAELRKEHRVCAGCGTSRSDAELATGGFIACCPERKMLTAREWYERATALEAELAGVKEENERLKAAKWEIKHVDTMNDMVLMGLARDEAEARAQAALSEITTLKARVAELEAGLHQCATQFEFYEQQHLAKSPPDLAKAETNGKMADMCRALTTNGGAGS